MKTKEAWRDLLLKGEPQSVPEFIAAIQLDAQRAAYAECAEIADKEKVDDSEGHREDKAYNQAIRDASHAILAARDNLKLP